MKIAFANNVFSTKNLIAGLVLAVIFLAVTRMANMKPLCKSEAEAFVRSSPEVSLRLGAITSVTLRKRTSVHASDIGPGYVSSRYIVRGAIASAMVQVRTDPTNCFCRLELIDPF